MGVVVGTAHSSQPSLHFSPSMKVKAFVMLVTLLSFTAARRQKGNCGLSCFRYNKCRGVLDGSGGNRPGQLGDTGIIVLEHCTPLLKKGCEEKCEEEANKDKTTEATTTTTTRRSAVRSRPRSLSKLFGNRGERNRRFRR